MTVDEFIEVEDLTIDGGKFRISRIPAVQAKAIYGGIMRATDDVGDVGMTFLPIELSKQLLSFAAYFEDDMWLALDSEDRINSAFPLLENLIKLETAMIKKNFGFLFNGGLRKVLVELRGKKEDTSKQA